MKRPRKAERYRSLDEVEVSGIVAFRGVPVSQSCGGRLPAGTVIRVLGDPNERASASQRDPYSTANSSGYSLVRMIVPSGITTDTTWLYHSRT
jgi:hypothetical protein